ncbi:hypothetical protein JOS77_18310 [Chromobacterium haemolyticum]|nr:hypothetical protein JOS77_18310 [Chromobacterium haemolyticum]
MATFTTSSAERGAQVQTSSTLMSPAQFLKLCLYKGISAGKLLGWLQVSLAAMIRSAGNHPAKAPAEASFNPPVKKSRRLAAKGFSASFELIPKLLAIAKVKIKTIRIKHELFKPYSAGIFENL